MDVRFVWDIVQWSTKLKAPRFLRIVGFNAGAVLPTLFRRFVDDRCLRIAGALSFTTLLALVPLLAVGLAMTSWLPVLQPWAGAFEEFVYKNFVPAASEVVRVHLQQFATQAARLTTLGLALLALSALLLLATIEDAVNDIWHVKRGRHVLQRTLTYGALLIVGPLLIGASLSMTYYLLSLPFLPESYGVHGVRALVYRSLPILLETLAFVLLYAAVPNCSVRVRYALIGGLFGAILFELVKHGFASFVLSFTNYEVIYGALAAIPIFLIWIYASWLVFLIGAELTAVLEEFGDTKKG